MFSQNWRSVPTKVAWDLGDTLVRIKRESLLEGAWRASITFGFPISLYQVETAIKAEWSRRNDPYSQSKICQVNTEEKETSYWMTDFYPCVLKRLGKRQTIPIDLIEYFCHVQMEPEYFELFPNAKNVLATLDSIQVEQCLLSNSFPSAMRIIKYHRLEKYFRFMILSHEKGLAKPDTRIYRLVQDNFNLLPEEEIIFIDDRMEFLNLSSQLKIRPIWFNNRQIQNPGWHGSYICTLKEIFKYFFLIADVTSDKKQTIHQRYLFQS